MRSPEGERITIITRPAQMFLSRGRDHRIAYPKTLPGLSDEQSPISETRNGMDNEYGQT